MTAVLLLILLSAPLPAEDLFLDSGGVKIHYIDQGEGEPVVLLHGLCGDIEKNWKATGILRSLLRDHRTISIDLRGHGKSSGPRDPMGYGLEMAKDVIRLLDHLKIEKAHLVGFSYGGTVALKLLATWPERLRSVVLAETSWAREGDREFVAFYDNMARSLEEGKGFTAILKSLSAEQEEPMPVEEMEKINKAMAALFDFNALAMLLRGSRELGVAEESLKANKIPCLALYGGKSRPAREGAHSMKKVMKNLETFEIKGGDHFNVLVMPGFVREIKAFLSKNTSS
jgi:pimeloyl-ACP methyl ester carboxylesterase